MADHQLILILDYGSQYTQLIARRIREQEVFCEVVGASLTAAEILARGPIGVVLSGGPQSVAAEGAPTAPEGLYDLGVPILGLCYGMQLMARDLGGSVVESTRREYGRAEVEIGESALFEGLDELQTVWMSHGDHVGLAPSGARAIARSDDLEVAGFEDRERGLFALQFHPEVEHTKNGRAMLRNFLFRICGASGDWTVSSFRQEAIAMIRDVAGDDRVIVALSGGVDSSVMALLLREAVGDRATPIFVDNGLLRKDEGDQVQARFSRFGLEIDRVDAGDRFLESLAGVTDPELKRKRIGHDFIEVFAAEARRFPDAHCLAQGTLYPDVIESVSVKGPSAVIKTHHNVGGLPDDLDFRLIEPLRMLFKDEVRALGRDLGLPDDLVGRHPFPGPGLAVRILGEVTRERLDLLREADAIFLEELVAAGWYDRTSQAFVVLLPVQSVGVMGDQRTYENACVIRSVSTVDFMTADFSRLPWELLDRVGSRIVNEVRGINRVAYDVTSKPPGTIEWE